MCNGTNTSSFRSSQIRTQRTVHTSLSVKRCTTPLCYKWHIILIVKIFLRKCITRVALVPEQHAPKGYEPNFMQKESGAYFISIADGDDEDIGN